MCSPKMPVSTDHIRWTRKFAGEVGHVKAQRLLMLTFWANENGVFGWVGAACKNRKDLRVCHPNAIPPWK